MAKLFKSLNGKPIMDCLKCLCDMNVAYKKRRIVELKEISERITNELIQEFSQEGVDLAIISYLLYKLLTKRRFEEEDKDEVGDKLNEICKRGNKQDALQSIKELNELALEVEAGDKRYVIDILTKARIKIAAKLYAKGVSLGVVSKALGIPQQEIMSYAGKTMMFDRVKGEVTVKDRAKAAKQALLGG
jgi:phosphoglycolate phosphatase-like HAD superfamily hydrolase